MHSENQMENLFGWDKMLDYPGIFAKGSAGEDQLLKKRKDMIWSDANSSPRIRYKGPLAEHGVVPNHLDSWDRTAFTTEILECAVWAKFRDVRHALLVDWRLRWCRCYLDSFDFPYDKEVLILLSGEYWLYQSEKTDGIDVEETWDPLDYVLQRATGPYTGLGPYSTPHFAAKFLAHFRRIKHLEKESQNHSLGIGREWMQMGETWVTARTLYDHEKNIIRGSKSVRSGKKGADMRDRSLAPDTEARLEEMERLLGSTCSGNVSRAADQACRNGYGPTKNANVQLWKRHRNTK